MKVQLARDLLETQEGTRAEEILRKCVHCGFCNATCPTFNLLGDELDGPRGRIYLIKGMFESNEVNDDARSHLDRCLTCRNCETTCPSGVEYGELLELGRGFIGNKKPERTFLERVLLHVVPYYRRLRWLVRLGRLGRVFLAEPVRRLLGPLESTELESDGKEAKVTLLQGCAQRAMTPDVNRHLAKLLRARGIAVNVRDDEVCCGSLHLHSGLDERAREFMQRYVDSLHTPDTQSYVSTASGCGVTVKDYDRLLGNEKAREVATRTVDASEYLQDFSFERHPNIQRVALHNPCTLQHGQRVHGLIERILERTGYELVSVAENHICCGSAGSYSLLQPELADRLLERKVTNLEANSPDVIATANIGCQMHLAAGAKTRVAHWISLLR